MREATVAVCVLLALGFALLGDSLMRDGATRTALVIWAYSAALLCVAWWAVA